MDRLAAMKVFARVAELGSFSAAAEALELSRASVSTQVAALEKDLAARLLSRTTRKVALTDDGARFLQRCHRVFQELRAAEEELREPGEVPTGRLLVHGAASLGRQLVSPALPDLLTRYPSLGVDLRLSDRIVDPPQEGVDIALRGGTVSDPRLIARRVATSHWITCGSPAYLEQHGWPREPGDLRAHRLLGYRAPGAARPHCWFFREGGRQLSLEPACHATFDDPEALLAAAAQGGGIVQAMDLLAAGALEKRELVVVLPGTAVRGPPVSVIYPQAEEAAASVRLFVEFAAGLLGLCQRRAAGATGLMDAP
jgi:LysR family transcriptional regulator for bpeEF and oprC